MIICFNCSADTKKALDRLMATGQYEDYSDVISAAVSNMLVLQNAMGSKGSVLMPTQSLVHEDISPSYSVRSSSPREDSPKKRRSKELQIPVIPSLFRQVPEDPIPPRYATYPDDVWHKGQTVPLERWLFGQFNKLLPAKVSCRALAHLLIENPSGVSIKDAGRRIAEAAAVLTESLMFLDSQFELSRDDALSTAFPIPEDHLGKSHSRFIGHFVGDLNKNGQLSGLLAGLKLVGRCGRKNDTIALTQGGWSLARLENPILDGPGASPERLTLDERRFILNHIADHVPAEDFAYRTILSAIVTGANSPSALDVELKTYVSKGKNFTTSFTSAQRSGAVSRMADLGLVQRVRDGVRVSYRVTEEGHHYVALVLTGGFRGDQRADSPVVFVPNEG